MLCIYLYCILSPLLRHIFGVLICVWDAVFRPQTASGRSIQDPQNSLNTEKRAQYAKRRIEMAEGVCPVRNLSCGSFKTYINALFRAVKERKGPQVNSTCHSQLARFNEFMNICMKRCILRMWHRNRTTLLSSEKGDSQLKPKLRRKTFNNA